MLSFDLFITFCILDICKLMYICINGYLKKKAVPAKMEFQTSLILNCAEFLHTSRFISRSLNFILSIPHLLGII